MLCNTCSKLLLLVNNKSCIRCKGIILNNLSVICDGCSQTEKMCSICLKKLFDFKEKLRAKSNCSGCGRK